MHERQPDSIDVLAASPGAPTLLLRSAGQGDRAAYDRLFASVHDELRRVAQRQLRAAGDDTIQPTELVHELYLKLRGQVDGDWVGRAHFFGIAARAMRQILVGLARQRNAVQRGGEWARTTLTGAHAPAEARLDEVLALEDALDGLDERQRARAAVCSTRARVQTRLRGSSSGVRERS